MSHCEIAIIAAAGKGERMQPLTLTTPKPLVQVRGTAMIETILAGLTRRGVSDIYIVVGHLKEQFSYLAGKYPGVHLVENTEYSRKNNISSVHAVLDVLGTADCFITDGDLYISDPDIFMVQSESSCAFGKFCPGKTEEWCYHCDNGLVTHLGPGGWNEYTMGGITYLKQADALILADAVRRAYAKPGHERLFWDNVLDACLDRIHLSVMPLREGQVIELDSVEELNAFESTI